MLGYRGLRSVDSLVRIGITMVPACFGLPFLSSRLPVSIFCRVFRVPWETQEGGLGGLFTVLVPFSARVLGSLLGRPEEMGRGWLCSCGLPRGVLL